MAHLNLTGFGVSLKEIQYKDDWDWFLQIHDIGNLWRAHPTYLLTQIVMILGSFLALIHSLCKGGRWPYVWLGTVLHGIVVETIAYNIPEIDNFWHSLTPVNFLGDRFPLYIVLLYPVFIYNALYAVSRLQLPVWAEPLAAGLTVVAIDIPYDIISVKFLHWTWHDTDPNIYDRHYWVPWNSYYFHTTFACSFVFWFHFIHKLVTGNTDRFKYAGFFKEFLCMLVAGCLGMPGGVLLFIPLYHPLHDTFGIHSENTFFLLFTFFLAVIVTGIRTPRDVIPKLVTKSDWLLIFHLTLHYVIYLVMVVFYNPEDAVAIGLHEPIGKCDKIREIKNAVGMTLTKREYLCVTDYDEDYFDFKCLPGGKPPPEGSIWYTACGTPFKNRAEYIAIMVNIMILAFGLFYNYYFYATPQCKPKNPEPKQKLQKKKYN